MNPTFYDLYAAGWSLIPVGANKKPLIKWSRYQSERASLQQLEEWSQYLRPAIWAGVTGSISGRFTLDFDGEPGRKTMELLGIEPHRSSPSGGFHADFLLGDLSIKSLSKSKVSLGEQYPGLDIRGEGGYINLIGATDSGTYEYLSEDPTPLPSSLLPEDLISLISGRTSSSVGRLNTPPGLRRGAANRGASEEDAESLVAEALDRSTYGRNDAGFWLARHLRDAGCSYEESLGQLRTFWESAPETNPVGVRAPYEWSEALASLDSAWTQDPDPGSLCSDFPEIVTNGRQLADLALEALAVLAEANDPPTLFVRNRTWVSVRIDESSRAFIEALEPYRLRHLLSRLARWVSIKTEASGEITKKNAQPTIELMKDLLVADLDSFPVLEGIVEIPTLRADGSLLVTNGYDPESRLLLNVPEDLHIPEVAEMPTADDIARAVEMLDDLFSEFPFVEDGSRANAYGLLLSMVCLPSIPGLLPMAVVTAPRSGSGKSFMVKAAHKVATGRNAPTKPSPGGGREEEFRKSLTAALNADEHLIFIDNVAGKMNSPVLERALSSEELSDRLLGVSTNVTLTQHVVWVMTDNNVELGGDLPRRCYMIKLDPKMADPSTRVFKRPDDDLAWVTDHRGELLWACFTLARNWFAQGKPLPDGVPFASFDGWRIFVGGILQAAGIKGFLANLEETRETSDSDDEAWIGLLSYWYGVHEGRPTCAKDLLMSYDIYCKNEVPPRGLSESIDGASGDGSKASRLSSAVKKIQGRYFDETGLRVEKAGKDSHKGVVQWRVISDEPIADEGSKDSGVES